MVNKKLHVVLLYYYIDVVARRRWLHHSRNLLLVQNKFPTTYIYGILIYRTSQFIICGSYIYVGLSTDRVGLGLGLTRIRSDLIGWRNPQPTTNWEDDQIRRVGQGQRSGKWWESDMKTMKNGQNLVRSCHLKHFWQDLS